MLDRSNAKKYTCFSCGHIQYGGLKKCYLCNSNLQPQEKSSTKSDPKNENNDWVNRAQACFAAKKFKEAIIALSHAICEDGNNGLYYYKRAVIYNHIQETTKALADLRKSAHLGYGHATPAIRHLTQKTAW